MDGVEKVGELVNERVLVADLKAGHPPTLHVRLVAVGDVHAPPASDLPLVLVIEPLQPMQVVKVPARRRVLTVDLQRVERLVPARVARGFEDGE